MIKLDIEGIVLEASKPKYFKKATIVEILVETGDQVIPVQFEDMEHITRKVWPGDRLFVSVLLHSNEWQGRHYLNLKAIKAEHESNGPPCNDPQFSQHKSEYSPNDSPDSPF